MIVFFGIFFAVLDIARVCKFLVVGYGISGISTAKFLKKKGHEVIIYDDAIESTHKLIDELNFNEIDAIVKSPGIPFMEHNAHIFVKKAREFNVEIISHYDIFAIFNPEARVIAVTGTNGKSTTTALINHILVKSGVRSSMGGNIGIPYCDLPESDIYIFEMSSYELAVSQYLKFDICCVLNIEPDHLENHGSFENYIAAKHRGLDYAKTKIISYEDGVTMSTYGDGAIKISSVRDINADIHINEGTIIDENGAICDLYSFSELRGKHNHQNAAFAYAVCKHIGIFPKEIAKNIASFKSLPHRMSVIRKIGDILFVNDSKATNPDSAAKALDTYVGYNIFWLVGGRSKQTDARKSVDPYIKSVCKMYLFGEAMDEFEKTFKGYKETVRCETIQFALEKAYADASAYSGPSVIMLSPMCASYDQFDSYVHRGEFFCNLVNNL